MRDMYENKANDMLTSYHQQFLFKNTIFVNRKTNFENIMHATNLITNNVIESTANLFLLEREHCTNQQVQTQEKHRDSIVKNMQDLYDQMKIVVNKIKENSMTNERVKVFGKLTERENQDVQIIAEVRKNTMRCRKQIHQLQDELQTFELNAAKELLNMKNEKAYFMECFLTIRKLYEGDMKNDQAKLRLLIIQSSKTLIVI